VIGVADPAWTAVSPVRRSGSALNRLRAAKAHWALVRHGLGIGAMIDEIASDTPGIVRVLDDVPPLRFPIWLVTRRELRTSRRIRVVFEALAQGLASRN
jgi:DNA-binding transcriptional LysR family regulator